MTDREQGGGARGIDRVGGAHQVETVGDPPDDDVRDQPRDGFGTERRKHACSSPRSCSSSRSVLLGIELADQVERLPDDEPSLHGDRVAAVQVGALAEDHARAGSHLVRQLGRAGVARALRERCAARATDPARPRRPPAGCHGPAGRTRPSRPDIPRVCNTCGLHPRSRGRSRPPDPTLAAGDQRWRRPCRGCSASRHPRRGRPETCRPSR